MSAVNCMILFFFTTCWCNFGSCESSRIAECCGNCILKVPDKQLCNRTCTQLIPGNYSQANNIPTVPPVPDAPILLSSGYFTFTLDWGSYSHTKYNATPVVYVLEVTRHTNITDPFIILPRIQKYHTTTNTTFTIPEEFITKTANFSFRLAVVSFQATSDFSNSSPLYQTNSSCPRLEKQAFTGNVSQFYPCRMFNVRLNFTVVPIPFEKPKLFTSLYWEFPRALHNVLEHGELNVDVQLSSYLRSHCAVRGLRLGQHTPIPKDPITTDVLVLSDKQFYFGCSYDFQIYTFYNFDYQTRATFDIPDCFHGFCFCEQTSTKIEDLNHIRVDFREDKLYINKTTAHVTWSTEAWEKKPAYFKILLLKCADICPQIRGQPRDIVVADLKGTNNTYNFSYSNLTDGIRYHVIVSAFDGNGCQFSPVEGKVFLAVIPTTAPTTKATTLPTTIATMVPTTKPAISATPTIESTRVSTAAGNRMSSGTMAAIVVPIILFAVAGLLLAVFWFCRKQKKPFGRHFDDRASYPRNVGDVPSSPYANDR